MTTLTILFDVLLCSGLIWLAWRTVTIASLFHSVLLFMIFGFLMAVAWARLDAADLALAEAAIGAGVMGALLLTACRAAELHGAGRSSKAAARPDRAIPRRLIAAVCAAVGVLFAATMAWLTADPATPSPELAHSLDAHALSNPVSAVLLDFRGYDTLLEMAVLLVALLGTGRLAAVRSLPPLHPGPISSAPMGDALATMVTPILLVMAMHIYWTGAYEPGGAFQAGSLLGALGVMYLLTGRLEPRSEISLSLRASVIAGLAAFTVFACLGVFWRGLPLAYPKEALYGLVLVLEFSMMVSIAVTLALLLSASPGIAPSRRP